MITLINKDPWLPTSRTQSYSSQQIDLANHPEIVSEQRINVRTTKFKYRNYRSILKTNQEIYIYIYIYYILNWKIRSNTEELFG